jgi:uncharacterized protein with von Willebrand factor type A (vWA) domain
VASAVAIAFENTRQMDPQHSRDLQRVTNALVALAHRRLPDIKLTLLAFSDTAELVSESALETLEPDFVFGSNVAAALRMASEAVRASDATSRVIVLVTRGEPTAHDLPGGDVIFNYPPLEASVTAAVAALSQCVTDGVAVVLVVQGPGPYAEKLLDHARRLEVPTIVGEDTERLLERLSEGIFEIR